MSMEEKDSAISGPYEEFRICFCGKIPSGSVEWYLIDVSVEEACLSEKTESSTRKLTPFSVAKHLPSYAAYAALGGLIYSLGGRRPSFDGDDTLLKDVRLLDFKSLEDLKPDSIPPFSPSLSSELRVEDREPTGVAELLDSNMLPGSAQAQKSTSEHLGSHDILPGSGEAQSQKLSSQQAVNSMMRGSDEAQKSPSELMRRRSIFPDFNKSSPTSRTGLERISDAAQKRSQKSSKKFLRGHNNLPDSDKASPTPLTAPLTAPSVEDENWKRGLSMNFARYNPHTMVVDHKLYVLGGFLPNQNQADGWIEVFDPEKETWESLPSPPDQIHSSIMISGLLESKKEIIIAKQRWDCHPLLFYSYNITTPGWKESSLHSDSKASVHSNVVRAVILPPNIGRAVTVSNTLYWISTEEHNHECTIRAYDLDRNMWFEDHLNTATIFGRREYFSSIYSRGPGFLHLVDRKFCLLLQSTVKKEDPPLYIEYLYCVILDISPIYDHEHEDWGKFELRTVSVQKYSMDHYIDFLDCMLLHRGTGVKSVDHRERSTTQPQFPGGLDQPSH